MRHHFMTVAVIGAVLGITSCRSDSVTPPGDGAPELSASYSKGSGPTLVVDNDRADCPQADFNTIQAAVAVAKPGTTILVCAGEYKEQVLITKSELRLLAKGQPGDVVLDGFGLPTRFAGFFLTPPTIT